MESNPSSSSSGRPEIKQLHKEEIEGGISNNISNDLQTTSKKSTWRSKLSHPLLSAPLTALFPSGKPVGTHPLLVENQSRAAWRARKRLLRSLLVMLGGYILVLEPRSLKALGNAAFFACLVSVMVPATLPVTTVLLVGFMIVFGMCLGWAWGCAAMTAAVRARSLVVLAESQKRFNAQYGNAQNVDALYRVAIFQGAFLDWRSTLVTGVFLATGTFAIGYLRARAPKLMVVSIFATIVMDVILSYGPLFPFTQYTLVYSFLIPTGAAFALSAAGALLIFPESANQIWTSTLVDNFLTPIYERTLLYSTLLRMPPPSAQSSAWIEQHDAWDKSGKVIGAAVDATLGGLGTLELEVSFGRLSAQDNASLKDQLEELASKALGLGSLFRTIEAQELHRRSTTIDSSTTEEETSFRKATPRMHNFRSRVIAAEEKHAHSLQNLLPRFADASDPLRTALNDALLGFMAWLSLSNNTRWSRIDKERIEAEYQAQRGRVATLENKLREYRGERRLAIFVPFKDFFDPVTGKARHELGFSPISLMQVLAASDSLLSYSITILHFVTSLSELENKRRANKLWWPTGLRKIGKLALSRHRTGNDGLTGDGQSPDQVILPTSDSTSTLVVDAAKEEEELHFIPQRDATRRHNPDARAPRNASQRLGGKLYAFGNGLTTPEAIFAFKYAFVSVALWIPQIIKTSAYFTYSEKGLWALITAQTFLGLYAGDQIMATVQKIVGTVVGLVYGMVVWYAGNGRGFSRIGSGTAFFVFMIPLMALRIHTPPSHMQGVTLGGVTVVLVVGYSWLNGHLVQITSAGVGYALAWRRALLVIIGTVAAMIVMLLPGQQSSRMLVRRTHATCIGEIGRIYSAMLSHWIAEDRHDPQSHSTDELMRSDHQTHDYDAFTPEVQKEAREMLLATWVKLGGTTESIKHSTYELSLRGDWPASEYQALLRAQLVMMQGLGSLGQGLVRLDPAWRKMLIRSTAFLHPNLISDVASTFALLSFALRQGEPLPQATPGPLMDRLLYHDKRFRNISSSDKAPDHVLHTLDGARLGEFELTWEILQDERFGTYAATLLALASLLGTLDDAEIAVKALVGEISLPGYDYLLERSRNAV